MHSDSSRSAIRSDFGMISITIPMIGSTVLLSSDSADDDGDDNDEVVLWLIFLSKERSIESRELSKEDEREKFSMEESTDVSYQKKIQSQAIQRST